jgi:hypothetical protein
MKSRHLILASMLIVGILCDVAVLAEPPVGSRLGERLVPIKPKSFKAENVIFSMHNFASCLYFKRPKSVITKLVSLDPDIQRSVDLTLAEPVDCKALMTDDPWAEMTYIDTNPLFWRGILAEVVLKKKNHIGAKALPLSALPFQDNYIRPWFAVSKRPKDIDIMGVCMVETQPAAVLELLDTKPQSLEEKKSIMNVVGLLGPCLRDGVELKADRLTLRSVMAEAYFHRIYTTVDKD